METSDDEKEERRGDSKTKQETPQSLVNSSRREHKYFNRLSTIGERKSRITNKKRLSLFCVVCSTKSHLSKPTPSPVNPPSDTTSFPPSATSQESTTFPTPSKAAASSPPSTFDPRLLGTATARQDMGGTVTRSTITTPTHEQRRQLIRREADGHRSASASSSVSSFFSETASPIVPNFANAFCVTV